MLFINRTDSSGRPVSAVESGCHQQTETIVQPWPQFIEYSER